MVLHCILMKSLKHRFVVKSFNITEHFSWRYFNNKIPRMINLGSVETTKLQKTAIFFVTYSSFRSSTAVLTYELVNCNCISNFNHQMNDMHHCVWCVIPLVTQQSFWKIIPFLLADPTSSTISNSFPDAAFCTAVNIDVMLTATENRLVMVGDIGNHLFYHHSHSIL